MRSSWDGIERTRHGTDHEPGPLLIRLPDGGNAGVYPEAAGMMNVTPSILHLLGVSEAPYYWIGAICLMISRV